MAETKSITPGGRPRVPDEDRHEHRVTIYLTENQKIALDQMACSRGIPSASLVRHLITESETDKVWIEAKKGTTDREFDRGTFDTGSEH